LGQKYFDHIQEVGKEIYDENLDQFLENDLIGNPKQFVYGGGKISPTTLRYIKNCLDLSSICENEEISKVVEIGGGYGGLCKTLSVLCDFDEYINVDLSEGLKVQEKYLKNFSKIYSKIKFIPCERLDSISDIDLLISNYSLSELDIQSQLNYYDKVIKNSKIVYITYNLMVDNVYDNYNCIVSKLKDDGFTFYNNYSECGNTKNIIIVAKK
jgi:putative sugar O-methyltransferase